MKHIEFKHKIKKEHDNESITNNLSFINYITKN